MDACTHTQKIELKSKSIDLYGL
uniref:Uncharacterized protein n=1 Tax=Rhizophora mucronata TaxID=61149 RepID=A0A2P2NXL3_RHIMU